MRLAVISDVHGNSAAFGEVIHDIKKQEVDSILFLGDLVMAGPEPSLVISLLKELKPTCWLKGNTDLWLEEMSGNWEPSTEKEKELQQYYQYAVGKLFKDEIELIQSKSIVETVEYAGKSILCVHGSPRAVNEIMDFRVPKEHLAQMLEGVREDIIVCGHSHVPFIGEFNGKYIFNAGGVGKSMDGDNRASYGIVELGLDTKPKFEVRRISYPIEQTLNLAKLRDFPYFEKYEEVLNKGVL